MAAALPSSLPRQPSPFEGFASAQPQQQPQQPPPPPPQQQQQQFQQQQQQNPAPLRSPRATPPPPPYYQQQQQPHQQPPPPPPASATRPSATDDIDEDDDVVVETGVNVALGAIERVVETLPGSESCAALALPLGEGEVEIVLLVVGSDVIPGLREDICQAVRAALGRPAVPRRVAVVPEFPTLPNRKLDRAALRALATEPGRVAWLP